MRTQTRSFSSFNIKFSFIIFVLGLLMSQMSWAAVSYDRNFFTSLGVKLPKATTPGESVKASYNTTNATMSALNVEVGFRQYLKIEIPAGVTAGYATLVIGNSWSGTYSALYPAPSLPDPISLTGGGTGSNVLYSGAKVTSPIYANYILQNDHTGFFRFGTFAVKFVVEDVDAYNAWLDARGVEEPAPDETPTYTYVPPTYTYVPPADSTSTTTGTGSFGCGEADCTATTTTTPNTTGYSPADAFGDFFNRSSTPEPEPEPEPETETDTAAVEETNRIEVIQAILMELVSGLSSEDILVDGDMLTVTLDGGSFFAAMEESNFPATKENMDLNSLEVPQADNKSITITFLNDNLFSNKEGMEKLKAVSYNPDEISDFLLEEFADLVESVTVTDEGEMIIKTLVGNYSARFDYIITPIDSSEIASGSISFELLQDRDGDGQDDVWVHYADGTSQIMFFRAQ